jgi:hypothetical protein
MSALSSPKKQKIVGFNCADVFLLQKNLSVSFFHECLNVSTALWLGAHYKQVPHESFL